MNPGDIPEQGKKPENFGAEFNQQNPDIISVPGGQKIQSGQLDLANIRMRALSVTSPAGVNGLLLETIPGSGIFEYLFSSAGFDMPGGGFTGTVDIDGNFLPTVDATYALGGPLNQWNNIYLVNAPIVSSDINFKQDIRDSRYGLREVLLLKPIQYSRDGKEHIGFSAQQLRPILPEIVSTGSDGRLSITPDEIIPVLVKAIQELQTQVSALKG